MLIEIDISADDRNEKQNQQLETLENCVKILRAAGYRVKLQKYIVTKPNDCPGSIVID